ncbi:O-antigen ligase family protein [Polynucleobacter antarcticus]|uniref:O-antigen ligase n=1 Tax=Polynucleobacter antarcticus TaxID=1743162 RepID=A0A6M9Q110_9BURK|nr:O-antigen ligase family protein [Polynucleobacter antarcticus]QKM61883.1 hypothetical protein DCO16_01565 [Polynucleobacter antarcticus]
MKNTSSLDKIGLLLIITSSVLLGIWATMNTIALRNILLAIGGLLAIAYWWNEFAKNKAVPAAAPIAKPAPLKNTMLTWIAIALIGIMFLWVVAHYIFFSQNPDQQWGELRSTWLRAFVAVLIGSATGLALNRDSRFTPILWLGLFMSFVFLIGQYIPKALLKHSMFAVDWFGDYIYWAKFHGVLAGTLLIAGLLGLLVDRFYFNNNHEGNIYKKTTLDSNSDGKRTSPSFRLSYFLMAYAVLGICIAAYSFVFVFDAKAGLGMLIILIGFWVFLGALALMAKVVFGKNKRISLASLSRILLIVTVVGIPLFWVSANHIKNNPGWESLFEDVRIGVQIDKYKHWTDPALGFPVRADGKGVAGNTYERASLASAGLRVITLEPIGSGALRSFRDQINKYVPGYKSHPYTHSAWIDLGLTFGLPGLLLLPAALLLILVNAFRDTSLRNRGMIISLALAFLILYSVGEYGFQHSIEILFYIAGLLCGLSLVRHPIANDQYLQKPD